MSLYDNFRCNECNKTFEEPTAKDRCPFCESIDWVEKNVGKSESSSEW
jgi:rubrerythrin